MQALNINPSEKPNRRSEEEKKALITQWENSHQTISSFCNEQGIVHSLFYYWLKKHRNKQPSNQRIKAKSDFIGLEVMNSSSYSSGGTIPFAELVLPDGTRVTLFKEVTVSFLQSLLTNHSYAGSK